MASGWAMNRALKVVDEDLFQVLPRVDRVMSQPLEPRQGGGFQSYREIYDFSRVCASCYFDSGRVNP